VTQFGLWHRLSCFSALAFGAFSSFAVPSLRAQAHERVVTLKPGVESEQDLSPRVLSISLVHVPKGQFCRLLLQPNGLDLRAVLRSPASVAIADLTNPAGEFKPISISWISPVEGDYFVEVSLRGARSGKYTVTLSEARASEPKDVDRIAADQSFAEGRRLRSQASRAAFLQAVERFQSSAELWRRLEDPAREADALIQIGSIYNILNDLQKVLEYDGRALVLRRSAGDRAGEGEALNNIAVAYLGSGDVELALENLRHTLNLRREAGDRRGVAETLRNLATAYGIESRLQQCLETEQRAAAESRAIGDPVGEATALNGIGVALFGLGDYDRAIENQAQALRIHRESGDKRNQAVDLTNIGTAYLKLERPAKALEFLSEALELHRGLGARLGEATALQHIGVAHFEQHDYQGARMIFEQALDLHKALQAVRPQAFVLNMIASSYLETHQPKEALDRLDQSLLLSRQVQDRKLEAAALSGAAEANRESGRMEEALGQIEESIRLSESLRGEIASPELRASYLASVHERYGLWADILMELNRRRPGAGLDSRALEVSERARARSLLDLLDEARVEIREGVDPELLSREKKTRAALDAKSSLQVRILSGPHSREQAASIDKEVQFLSTQYREVKAEIRARSPQYSSLTQPEPVTVASIQGELLDENTVLLEYLLGAERSYLWMATPSRVRSFELPGSAEIETAARRAYQELSVNGSGGAPAIRALSHILLAPLGRLPSGKRLAIVADGALQYIPFAALTLPGEREELVVKHEIVHLPSVSTLALLRSDVRLRSPAPRLAAVLADPVFDAADPRVRDRHAVPVAGSADLERSAKEAGILRFERLRASRDEAEAIARLAGRSQKRIAVDFDANKDVATSSELSQYRIVHFATHGLINSRNPGLSGLVLSLVDKSGKPRDGFLTASEIFNLKLGADLVVLSACQTALGKEVRGEGLIGLTRGFMYAGSPRVIASLWRVPDQGTAELMRRFYEGLLGKGLTPAGALRAAQLAVKNDRRWQSPYHWAGFVLQGEWR
jgi:CHAT domain-containing protein/tetratricopeptide (TPR) repeat protein